MHRKTSLILILFLVILIIPSSVAAQSPLVLDRVEVELWPEYDRPDMLVLYRISLPATTPLPAAMTIRIPAQAGDPNAVAALVDGRLISLPYERFVDGFWAEIVFQTDSGFVQLEYYDPALSQASTNREFSYTWAGDYAVNNFAVKIQVPVGVSTLDISPDMSGPSTGADGLNYYEKDFSTLAAGETLGIELSYQKNNNTLTSALLLPEEPAVNEPASAEPVEAASISILAIAGIGVGLLMIVGGLLYNSRAFSSRAAGKDSTYRAKKRAARAGRQAGAGFCHSCGTPAQAGDRFCRECGSKLRV